MASTNGNFRVEGFSIDIAAGPGVTTTYDLSYPYNTSIRGVSLFVDTDNIGDVLNVTAAPDTVVGTITSPISLSDTVIEVTPSVIANVQIGYLIKVSDGVNTSDLGEIVGLDIPNTTITVSNPADNNYATGDVLLTISRIKNMPLKVVGPISIGRNELGGAVWPAGVAMRTLYTNEDSNTKKLHGIIELFY